MKTIKSENEAAIKLWVDDAEPEAMQQLHKLASLPFIYKHVSVMPDAHAGKGSTVGTVIATQGAIIPAAVGVDIGCGMMACKLPFKIDVFENLSKLRASIERSVPVGFNSNKEVTLSVGNRISTELRSDLSQKHALQIGTLGGGNHFIEICGDENNDAWVILHSGSRNLGKTSAEKHIDKAKGLMKQYFIDLPDSDLAYLAQGTIEFDLYLQDLLFSQKYASINREEMMNRILKDIYYHLNGFNCEVSSDYPLLTINCHHNFTQMENHFGKNIWITRKGAVSAREGQYGIIPGSMGTKSYIVKGLGNVDSFCSCSHGAGRKMSRAAARKLFNIKDLQKQTAGVECRKDIGIVDEIPSAYKDIDVVMDNQKDLVEIVHTLKQIMCIKG
jgi:tRNA-splicing ligase RtcB